MQGGLGLFGTYCSSKLTASGYLKAIKQKTQEASYRSYDMINKVLKVGD
jgi:hypothetical protein